MIVSRMMNQNAMQTQRPGWSWPRFPWQRNENQRFRQTPSSPDSQYGFSTNMSRLDNSNMMQSYTLINNPHHFGIWGMGNFIISKNDFICIQFIFENAQQFFLLHNLLLVILVTLISFKFHQDRLHHIQIQIVQFVVYIINVSKSLNIRVLFFNQYQQHHINQH